MAIDTQTSPEIFVAAPASEAATPPRITAREWLFPAGLAILLLVQLLAVAGRLSQTSDEANHLHAGYRYWQCRDFGYNVEHPPLAKLAAALPGRLMSVRDPFPRACGVTLGSDFQTGRQFLYAENADRLLTAGRAAVSIFCLATLLLAWFWTRAMFGRAAAAIAALLLAFEPNLLAHGALIDTDAAIAFGVLASVAALWFCARKWTWTLVVLAGLSVGIALTSKYSGVIVLPILLVLLVTQAVSARKPGAQMRMPARLPAIVVAGCIAISLIWASYGFRFAPRPGGVHIRYSVNDWQSGAARFVPPLLRIHALPEAYLVGLGYQLARAGSGEPMFLFGRLYPTGRWFYFPALLLIKLTLPMLFLIALAVALPWWRGRGRDALYLLVPIVVFLGFAMRSKLDIGVRHVLPVIVLLAIVAGAAAAAAIARWSAAKWVIAALLLFHVATSLHAFPSYISYANEAWGGPSKAYRQATDSNTDWGQALKQVASYEAKSAAPCWILSPYPIPLAYNGVLCRDLRVEPAAKITGTVFVSSTAWSGVLAHELGYDPGATFRERAPSDTVGGSAFLVYRGDFDLHTNLSLVYSTTAQVLLAQGRAREALEYAQQASQLRPDAGTPHYVACGAEMAASVPDLARHECAEAVRLLGRNPDFNRRLLDAVHSFMMRTGVQ